MTTKTGNARYDHWRSLFPDAMYYKYSMWLKEVLDRAAEQGRGDVVQVMSFGDKHIANHDNFTKFVTEQTN